MNRFVTKLSAKKKVVTFNKGTLIYVVIFNHGALIYKSLLDVLGNKKDHGNGLVEGTRECLMHQQFDQ